MIQASQHAADHRKAAFVVSPIRPDVLEPRETALERCEQVFAPVLVLKTGLKEAFSMLRPSQFRQEIARISYFHRPISTTRVSGSMIRMSHSIWGVNQGRPA